MPAYFDSGFSVREPMWHGLGTVLGEYPTNWDEARRHAGLEWEPVEIPLYSQHTTYDATGARESFQPVPDFKGIARSDTGLVLSVPSSSYEVITHEAMGELCEALLEEGNLRFETAGSVKGGRQVWALVYLDEPFTLPGDDSPTLPFMALLNSHDGTAACQAVMTNVRVVCWNTYQLAQDQAKAHGQRVVIRHTGGVAERLEAARGAIKELRAAAGEYSDAMTELAQAPVDETQIATFTQLFLPSPADVGEFCSDRVAANVAAARGAFRKVHDESLTTEGIRGTGYGLFQSATEYLDHVRVARSSESRLNRSLLRPCAFKDRALSLAREVALV